MNPVWIRMGPLTFQIRSSDERVLDTIREMWAPVLIAEPDTSDFVETEIEGGPPWRYWMGSDPSPVTQDPWKLLAYVRSGLDQMLMRDPVAPRLHASAVALESGLVVLFPGEAGAGKTTLSLTFVDRGASLLLDDLGFLDPSSRQIQGIPRPIGIRATIAFERFESRWTPPTWLGRPQDTYVVPFQLFAGPPPAFSPDVIVFPRFAADGRTVLDTLSKGGVVARLGRHVVPLSGIWMPLLVELVAGTQAFEVAFSNPDEAADRLEHVLRTGKAS